MRTKIHKLFVWSLALLYFALLKGTAIGQPASKPVKLVVQSHAKTVPIGTKAEIEIVLQDANNKAVKAAKDIVVEIEVRSRAGRKTLQDTIKANESSKKLQLPLGETGFMEIHAKHLAKPPELLEGGTVIYVRPQYIRSRPKSKAGALMPGFEVRFASTEMTAHRQLSASDSSGPYLIMKSSPQRPLLADGKDAATIHIFLYSEEGVATNNIRVRLFNSGGRLDSNIVIIPTGEDYGKATLTSDQLGVVTVEYLGSTPKMRLEGDRKLQITFGPPITQVALKASPPIISLLDKSDLIVQLSDMNGRPIPTDTPRQISFAIERGRGEIEQEELSIPSKSSESRTTFIPTWWGQVIVSTSTPNLHAENVELNITLPGVILILSALGGLVGGLIAFWIRANSKWWRIVIGLFTGFVLYWAFIFGVLTVIPRVVVLNPLSAFVLSTLGGWLGTEVFTQILKRLGLVSQATAKK